MRKTSNDPRHACSRSSTPTTCAELLSRTLSLTGFAQALEGFRQQLWLYLGRMVKGRDNAYFALSTDGCWIDRLRARLPYSFEHVETEKSSEGYLGKITCYVLSGPVLQQSALSAEYHNFWRRGHAFYMVGKLIDYHSMAEIWQHYRTQIGLLRFQPGRASIGFTAGSAFEFYNSMQLEKVWRFTLDNILDRERVMMTNLTQSLELCLKAIITHANHLETGRFEFPLGHNINRLYSKLPAPLRDEIAEESQVFADSYSAYRSSIESEVRAVRDRRMEDLSNMQVARDERNQWEEVASHLNDSDYTAFINSNDPGMNLDKQRGNWLSDALSRIDDAHGFGDAIQYYRYAPKKDTDDLPTEPINSALLLGRFFYEHLFPMPTDPQTPITTQLLE